MADDVDKVIAEVQIDDGSEDPEARAISDAVTELNQAEDIPTNADLNPPEEESAVAPAQVPALEVPAAAPATPPLAAPGSYDTLRQQHDQLQRQYSELEQQSMTQGIDYAQAQYAAYLEQQGQDAETAQREARAEADKFRTQLQQQQSTEYSEARYEAAIRYAKQHDLGLDDLARLRQARTGEEMHRVAREVSDTRKMRQELNTLKKQVAEQRIPAQTFESGRGVTVISNDDKVVELASTKSPERRTEREESLLRERYG